MKALYRREFAADIHPRFIAVMLAPIGAAVAAAIRPTLTNVIGAMAEAFALASISAALAVSPFADATNSPERQEIGGRYENRHSPG